MPSDSLTGAFLRSLAASRLVSIDDDDCVQRVEREALDADPRVNLVDDMLPQPNWPAGHADKAGALLQALRARPDLATRRQRRVT